MPPMPALLRTLWLSLALVALAGCTQTLRITRRAPPTIDLGGAQPVGLSITSDVGQNVTSAVMTGLLTGQLNVPVDPVGNLTEKLMKRLPEAGVPVCGAAPCGEVTLEARVVEATVAPETHDGVLRTHAKLRAKVRVLRKDGSVLYEDEYWSSQNNRVDLSAEVLPRAADGLATRVAQDFLPNQVTAVRPVDDDGALEPGAAMLLSGNIDGAEQYLNEVLAREPNNAGAYYDLGLCAEVRNDVPRAKQLYEQAIARSPKRRYVDAAAALSRR